MSESLLHRVQERVNGPATELVPGVFALVRSEPRGFEAMVYEPLLCTILQGEKSVEIGGRVARVHAGESILVCHPLPVVSRITLASPGQPYVALVARLDLGELGALAAGLPPAREAPVRALDVAPTDPWTLDVLSRTVDLVDDPETVPVLLPLLRRELHFRLLRAGLGAGLRTLLAGRGQARPIGQAIRSLRGDLRQRLDVDALARSVGMSPSAFYRHFKAVADTTPLQFLKDLRLTEARRLLQAGGHGVATVAFDLGYESPSQFSREYHRRFGNAPSRDLPARGAA